MFYARTVSFYLRDFNTFFASMLPRTPLPADIQGWLYSCCSVAKPSPPLCDPWTAVSGFLHYHPEFAYTNIHWVSDTIQPSHPTSPSSPLALSFSYHQGLFQRVSSSHQGVKVLELQLQHQSFQWIFRVDFPYDWLVWSCIPRDFQESSLALQFKSFNSLAFSFLYGPSLTSIQDYWKNHCFD